MTIHIQKFVDKLRGLEMRGQKDFVMSLNDAKDLHADITRVLLTIQDLRELSEAIINKSNSEEVTQISVSGGSFK